MTPLLLVAMVQYNTTQLVLQLLIKSEGYHGEWKQDDPVKAPYCSERQTTLSSALKHTTQTVLGRSNNSIEEWMARFT